ncbi:diaminobutyrate--2-oxoglutarate transaminase [Marinicrinis sediminis]|uniref:Diaminobutyrate--2-oxoglutarate transaminase n=1 Tax=Marinicrinis sediminis TaxID=1652465 RepID=A0ABW5RCG2_9BACL
MTRMETNESYLTYQSGRESNARSYPRRIPIALREGKGIVVKDVEGKSYYDCLSGAGTLALGHHHPAVTEAMQDVWKSGVPLHTLDLTSPVKEAFMKELLAFLPASFARDARIQFCGPTGADAVEAAVKLVKTATGRTGMMSFQGGYHGMTHGALSLTGNIKPKQALGSMNDVQFLPYPYAYRCPFGLGGECCDETAAHYIAHMLQDPESGVCKPAGMIMEMVQGEGGVIPAPNRFAARIRQMTKEHGIPLLIDEVQTGFGRTGKRFAFEHADIVPDVLILSKAIGGSLPLSVVVYHKSLDVWQSGAHAGTFRGNVLAMAAGTATMKVIQQEKLEHHAEQMGLRFESHFHTLRQTVTSVGDVRVKGLMIGLEIVNPDQPADRLGHFPADPKMAADIQKMCIESGLIVELGGRHGSVLRLLPPLIVTPEQVDDICTILEKAIHRCERNKRTSVMQEV